MTQLELEDDDDSGGERPLYIKEEDDDEEALKEEVSMDSTDGNDTRLSDLHNTTLKTEEDSEEDKPLVNFALYQSKAKNRKKENVFEIIVYIFSIFCLSEYTYFIIACLCSKLLYFS